MRNYVLITFFSLLAKLSLANIPHLYALHINGINTSRVEAKNNYIALQKTAQVDSNMVIFNVIWNPTGDDAGKNTFSNLNDVIKQKAQEQQLIMTLDDFTDFYISQYPSVYPPAIYHRGTPEYARLQKEIPDIYYQELNKIAGPNFSKIIDEFHNLVPPPFVSIVELLNENPNTHNNRGDYPKTVNLGKSPLFRNTKGILNQSVTLDYSKSLDYILLIPHSQGNLYANSLYDYLIKNEQLSPKHIAIYGIATPATENRGGWVADLFDQVWDQMDSYITSSNDYVINATRQLFMPPFYKPVLPANITIPFAKSVDWGNGHNLINVYLKDNEAKSQIAKMIHLELFYFTSAFIFNDLDTNNFLLSIYNQEFGGGLISPAGVVCLDGICDSNVSYFAASNFEVKELQMDSAIISFVPKEYFPAGEYFSIVPLYNTYGLRAQQDDKLNITYTYVITDYQTSPPTESPVWSRSDGGFTCGARVKSSQYYLYPSSQFWNGRFITERAIVY